jgi:uncharacterized membrane protein YczE
MKQRIKKRTLYRVLYAIIGITIISIGLAFMRYANLGIDPLSCLNTGVSKQLGISFGTWQLILFVIILIGVFFFDRSKIGFGTFYNMITVGYASDILLYLIKRVPLFEASSLHIRIASFVFGIPVLYFGAALYIETNTGTAPYDSLAIIIAEKLKNQAWFRWIRIATDALCVCGGILAQNGRLTQSGIGIGTILTVLFAGPLIAFFRKPIRKSKSFKLLEVEMMWVGGCPPRSTVLIPRDALHSGLFRCPPRGGSAPATPPPLPKSNPTTRPPGNTP